MPNQQRHGDGGCVLVLGDPLRFAEERNKRVLNVEFLEQDAEQPTVPLQSRRPRDEPFQCARPHSEPIPDFRLLVSSMW